MANDLSLALRIKAAVDGLASIGALIDEIKQLGGDSEAAGKMAGHLGQELDDLAKQQQLIDDFATLKREVTATGDALEASRAKTADLARQFNAAEAPSKTLTNEFARARTETRQLADQEERQRLALQQLRGELSAAGLGSQKLALSQAQVRQAVTETEGRMTALKQRLTETRDQAARKFQDPTPDMKRGAQDTEKSVNSLGEALKNTARNIAAWAAAALGLNAIRSGLQSIIDVGAKFETLQVRLDSLMGSLEGGQQAVDWIKNFAKTTPLQLDQVTEAFARLKTYGLDPMDGTLQALVDANAKMGGSQELLERIILAVGQAWTKQKLEGQEVMQLNEAGIPVWDLLSKALGKSVIELQNLSQQGRIGREEIRLLIEEIGKSSTGAAAAQMATWNGLISNLKDSWMFFLNNIAQSGALDYFKQQIQSVLDKTTEMARDGSLQRYAKQTADAIVGFARAIKSTISLLIDFKDAILLAAQAFVAIKIANLTLDIIKFADKVIPAFAGAGTAAEGAAGMVGLFGRILRLLPRNFAVAIAIIGGDLAVKAAEWLGETLAKLSPAGRAAEQALQRLQEQATRNAAAAQQAAAAHQQFADVQIKSASEIARMTDAERVAYAAALKGAEQYQIAVLAAARNQEILGQKTGEAQGKAIDALKAIRAATQEIDAAAKKAAQSVVDNLGKAVNALIQDFERAKQGGKSVAEAIADMFGKDFATNSLTAIRNMGDALAELERRGVLTAAQVRDAWSTALKDKPLADVAAFQAKATAAFGDTADKAQQLAGALDASLAVSLGKLGLNFDELKTGIDDNVRAFENLANNGAASAEMLRAAFAKALDSASTRQEVELLRQLIVQLGKDGTFSLQQVTLATEELNAKLNDVTRQMSPLEEAFKQLGITSQKALEDSAAKAQAAFEIIRANGTTTAQEVQAAFTAYAQKAIAANNGVASAELRGYAGALGLSDALTAAGSAGQTAGDKISNAMDGATASLRNAAQAADDLKRKQAATDAQSRTGFSAALAGPLLDERSALQQTYGDAAAAQFDALMKRDVINGESVSLFMDRFGKDLERLKAQLADAARMQASRAADLQRAAQKTVNVTLAHPNGQKVTGIFTETDANTLINILAQQGARVTG